jgi:hypothetical protein
LEWAAGHQATGPPNKSLQPTALSSIFLKGALLLQRFVSGGVTLRKLRGG